MVQLNGNHWRHNKRKDKGYEGYLNPVCRNCSTIGLLYNIEINDKELARLVVIADGEEVYPSINTMKRYIDMLGKEVESKKVEYVH